MTTIHEQYTAREWRIIVTIVLLSLLVLPTCAGASKENTRYTISLRPNAAGVSRFTTVVVIIILFRIDIKVVTRMQCVGTSCVCFFFRFIMKYCTHQYARHYAAKSQVLWK